MSPKSAPFCRYFLFCVFNILFTYGYTEDTGESEMEKFQVVPDAIDKTPADVLDVTYCSKKVNLGNELTPTDVKNAPTVKWDADSKSLYVLLMIDLDAPCEKDPALREYQHWLVGNIPGRKVNLGDVLTEYVGAFPGKSAGTHRYVLLVFKQPEKLKFDEKKLTTSNGKKRGKFSTRKFAEKYNLGCAIAGNFFQAQWDSYVPTIEKQLTN